MQINPKYVSKIALFSVTALCTAAMIGCESAKNYLEASFSEVTVNIPWFTEGSKIEIQKVNITKIHALTKMEGDFAQFYVSPGERANSIDGKSPNLAFVRLQDGSFLAKNTFSMELASIYAHLERLAKIDQGLPVDLQKVQTDLASANTGEGPTKGSTSVYDLNHWPRKVGVRTISANSEGQDLVDRAFYNAKYDAILINFYLRSDLPLTFNGGVLAHEHFHSLYQRLVLDHRPEMAFRASCKSTQGLLPKSKAAEILSSISASLADDENKDDGEDEQNAKIDKEYLAYLDRGFNEGLADLWGWLYTDDVNFVAKSFASIGSARSLGFSRPNIISPSQFSDSVKSYLKEGACTQAMEESYRLGNQVAVFGRTFLLAGQVVETEQVGEKAGPNVANDFYTKLNSALSPEQAQAARAQVISTLLQRSSQLADANFRDDTTSLIYAFVKSAPNMNFYQCNLAKEYLATAVGKAHICKESEGVYTLVTEDNNDK